VPAARALCGCAVCLVLGALCLVNEYALPKLRSNLPSTKQSEPAGRANLQIMTKS